MTTKRIYFPLQKCPFCGNEASFVNELEQDFREERGKIVWGVYVKCDECGCTLGEAGMNSQECVEGEFSTFYKAAKAWNTRK